MDFVNNFNVTSLENIKILIVDDEVINRNILINSLKNLFKEIDVLEASSGIEAYNCIKNEKIDIVFLDIIMPEMDGFQLIERLKNDNLFDNLVIIVISALEDSENINQAFLKGVFDYIVKPLDTNLLNVVLPIKVKNLLIYKKNLEYLKSINLKIEAEIKSKMAELIHSDRLISMGIMTTSILHEINTPITYIKGNIDLFYNYYFNFIESFINFIEKLYGKDSEILNNFSFKGMNFYQNIEKFKELIKNTQLGISKIIEIIQNFRSFAKKDEEKISYFDINELIENVISIVKKTIESKAKLNFEKGDVGKIKINKAHFEQIIVNLILNSYQAIKEKGTINIKTYRDNSFDVIEIVDDGIGMDEETLNRAFEPFFSTKGDEGTGLGLYITSTLVKNYGGKIFIESEINKGTKVKLIFNNT
ncbi:MAG: response regulator [Spirochaetes bacterium]|nr:response regulator [Spirochaetota bacterium]